MNLQHPHLSKPKETKDASRHPTCVRRTVPSGQQNPPCEDPFLSYAGDSWFIRAHKVQGNTKNQPVWEALE